MKEKLLKFEAIIVDLPTKIKSLLNHLVNELFSALSKLKDLATTNYELGLYHMDNGNINDAKLRFMLVVRLKPELALAHYHLARCYLFNLNFNKARAEFEAALALNSNMVKARYRLDLLDHSLSKLYIPVKVTKEDYNTLSKNYENYMLEQHGYQAPELLVTEMEEFIKDTDKVLDIGCGTGLVGASLIQRISVKSLTGLDISTKMLELAKALKIGDDLVYNDVKEIDFHNLESIQEKFDVITACMSFGYANNLASIFQGLNNLSVKGTILGLVVLKSAGEDIDFNYDYATLSFSEKYLNSIFKQAKWSIKKQQEVDIFVNNTPSLMFILEKN